MMEIASRSALVLVALAVPLGAAAQTEPNAESRQAPTPVVASNTAYPSDSNRWIVSGFVGSNFANNAQPASLGVGGSLANLLKNRYGAELEVAVSPDFQLQNNFFGYGNKPMVNSYMANAIWAPAIGPERQIQPYV